MQIQAIIHDADFPLKIEELKSNFSSRAAAIQEVESILITLYKIKIYQNSTNDSLERSIILHYSLKLALQKTPDWKIKESQKESIFERISNIISIITNPIQWYPLARNEYLKIKEKEKKL